MKEMVPHAWVQILSDSGEVLNSKIEPKLSKENLLKLYQAMVTTRQFDERALLLQRQGRIGFCVTSTGQEAIAASGLALEERDWVFPAYREHAVGIVRGLPLRVMMNQLFGNTEDLAKGRQMPNHFAHRKTHFVSISSPIGTQISQAAGAAMAAQIKNDKVVTITYFGDGGTSSNDFHAGINFAGA